ncbi:hypothetical protein ACJZ2D_013069 [Fusarium nematophilum]
MESVSHLLDSADSLMTDETTCPSTLRSRLFDDDTPTTSSETKQSPYQDIYQQIQACFGDNLLVPGPEDGQPEAPDNSDPGAQLREAFAQMGVELHASAIDHLIQAHSEVQSRINRFSDESSNALSQCKDLYSNIAYPLSATLCHSDDFPTATIRTHLATLNQEIEAAKEELERLGDEWDACVQTEMEA